MIMKFDKKTVRKELLKLSEGKYKKFTQALNPGIDNLLGVRIPALRKLANEIFKYGPQSYLEDTDIKYTEELMLEAMIICKLKDNLDAIKSFITKINGWAVCDTFCCGLNIADADKPKFLKFISPYIRSENEFDVRFCAISLLAIFDDPKYAKKALALLNKSKHLGYYAKMGVAWAVSVFFVKAKEETTVFLKKNSLDDFTHNKSIQKICESFRVSEEDRKLVRSLKRK
jgi:3-methyladenine DNA glycosylase AlkD